MPRAPASIILFAPETRAPCSFETHYLAFNASGAAAVIWLVVDLVPSPNVYSHDGSQGAHTRHLPMLFVRLGPSTDLFKTLAAHAPGQNVTVYADTNVWQATFSSWYYQLFIRILPSAVLIGSGVMATAFFVLHMRLINDHYAADVPAGRRSCARWVNFVLHSLGLPHAVLAIEMTTATLSGIILAIGGYYSTPNLSYPVVQYFVTLLGGFSLASSILSAAVWNRQLAGLFASESLLTRVLRGDIPVAFVPLATVPVVLDTAISASWATYYYSSVLTTIAALTMFLLQLTVGLHVLVYVIRYHRVVVDLQSKTNRATRQSPGMGPLLARLSRCALGMSLSMILVCIGTALTASSAAFLNSPMGWTTCFLLTYNGRALDTAFRVAMFKPRYVRYRTDVSRLSHVTPKTNPKGSTTGAS